MASLTRRVAGYLRGPELPTEPETRALSGPFPSYGLFVPPPGFSYGSMFGGAAMRLDTAVGLSAVTAAIRIVTETIAGLPVEVYRGRLAGKRLADNSWQHTLLYEQPSTEMTPFDFMADIVSSIESRGNAFVRKVKVGEMVVELIPIDPDVVYMKRDENTGDKVFQINDRGSVREFGTDEILHIRGPVIKGGQLAGYDPITLHAGPLSTAAAQEAFVGRYFTNDARPGTLLTFPQTVNRSQAQEWIDLWNEQHAGVWNAHKTAIMGGGADIRTVPINMVESQMTQAREYATKQVAEIFRVPLALLTGDFQNQRQTTEQEQLNFLNFSLLPRIRRIESALRLDRDLFPLGSGLQPEFNTDGFLRTDAATQAAVDHQEVQSGIRTRNEIRARRGLAPLPPNPDDPSQSPGDVVPELPVGAGPNSAGSQRPDLAPAGLPVPSGPNA